MKTQGSIHFTTPAKINPFLRVLSRRSDGYHNVQLGYVAISLYDRVSLEVVPKEEIELRVEGLANPPPPESNLVVRAARAFAAETGTPSALRIILEKRIPSGAGLGGGSGNAAGMLMALNQISGNPLSMERLHQIATSLGADVPFFLTCRPSIGTGRGEELTPLPLFPALHLVVVMPQVSISTSEAYGMIIPRDEAPPAPDMDTKPKLLAALENDFEPPTLERYPVIAEARSRLLAAGAQGALLSGSGAALFGVFDQPATQKAAVSELARVPGWKAYACQTIADHTYLA